jgi:intron-binding protein aquarius
MLPLIKEKHFYKRAILGLESLKRLSQEEKIGSSSTELNLRKFSSDSIENINMTQENNTDNNTTSTQNSLKLIEKMLEYLKFYLDFEINEETGENLSHNSILSKHYKNLSHMLNIAFNLFPYKLSRIYLKNISLIDNTQNI